MVGEVDEEGEVNEEGEVAEVGDVGKWYYDVGMS